MSIEDGIAIARELIAQEAKEKSGKLDLRDLGLEALPEELGRLVHLVDLRIGNRSFWNEADADRVLIDDNSLAHGLGPVRLLAKLQKLDCRGTNVSDLAPISGLANLQSLDCSHTHVLNLAPVSGLANLQSLRCKGTHVSDLTPISGLANLQSLDCSRTQISDLTPISGLSSLRSLDCSHTNASDLTPVCSLAKLQSLNCRDTEVSDLTAVSGLADLQSLDCSHTDVSDLTPVSGLANLQSLDCRDTGVSNLTPVSGLANLQSLDCRDTEVSDLTPVLALANLQSLDCRDTEVSDLTPISALTGLLRLDCSYTEVSDLTPVSRLINLQSLHCRDTAASDLMPVSRLANLQSLDFRDTEVSDLTPVSDLGNLQSLDCSSTQVADLTPVRGLANLQSLDCSGTQVSDLTPVRGLANLQSLDCSYTQVSDLTRVSGLANLQSLYCSGTQVSDLAPVCGLANLLSLGCSHSRIVDLGPIAALRSLRTLVSRGNNLSSLPSDIAFHPRLTILDLDGCRIPGIPMEVLASDGYAGCRKSLRAHIRDQAGGAIALSDVKLLVIGNGKAGKTQIVNRLSGRDFNQVWDSTHGIRISRIELPGVPAVAGHIWDFGGQDIYHGTHALFARSAGLFLVVWATDSEALATYTHRAVTFRNHPLHYWIAHARHYAGKSSPVIVVQAKCDSVEEECRRPPVEDTLLHSLPYGRVLHHSSYRHRGHGSLVETLCDAVAWLHDPSRGGKPRIGLGRLAVRQRLEALRDADAGKPVEQRLHRWITHQAFRAMCEEDGRISDPDAFLRYLHNAGVLFHWPGLFDDRIILDQQWALDAVYAVFNRERCFRHIRAQNGRFTRPELGELVWHDYGEAEQELLLSMMRTCGICFQHRAADLGGLAVEYVAPDLLPDRTRVAADLDERWDDADGQAKERRFAFPLLLSALIRSLICRIGEAANVHGLYWQKGVYAYDRATRSRALIEQVGGEAGVGEIVLRTRDGAADQLLDQLSNWIEEEAARLGLAVADRSRSPVMGEGRPTDTISTKPDFGAAPRRQASFFVSYAWGSNAPGASELERLRAGVVDRLCAEAKGRGVELERDSERLGYGDRITKFMDEMIDADRIAVILSHKYLHSPWCMYELCGIWRMSRQRDNEFLRRVRVFALPDASFGTPAQRLWIAAHWQKQYDEIKSLLDEYGTDIMGEQDFRQYRMIKDFRDHVGDILATIADTVRPVDEAAFRSWTVVDLFEEA
jgi:internalin A